MVNQKKKKTAIYFRIGIPRIARMSSIRGMTQVGVL